jgi:hypothetical protein
VYTPLVNMVVRGYGGPPLVLFFVGGIVLRTVHSWLLRGGSWVIGARSGFFWLGGGLGVAVARARLRCDVRDGGRSR